MENKKAPLLAIVDDEIHIRESLSQYLSQIGHFRTKTFADGNEVITWLKDHSCDVCIVDIKMPGINGIDTIKEIKKFQPNQKFIIFTGSRFQDISGISEELEIPEDFIIVKPLPTMEIFLDRVGKMLEL